MKECLEDLLQPTDELCNLTVALSSLVCINLQTPDDHETAKGYRLL